MRALWFRLFWYCWRHRIRRFPFGWGGLKGAPCILCFKEEVVRTTRNDAAYLAALETNYWSEDPRIEHSIGAMGAAANISAALSMNKSAADYETELRNRGSHESGSSGN